VTSKNTDWKRRAEAVFAPLREIDRSWLPRSLQDKERLLDVAMLRQSTRKLIYKCLSGDGRAIATADVSVPLWAQKGAAAQRRTVMRLGALACSAPIKRTIEQMNLGALRRAIGEASYREALDLDDAMIRNSLEKSYWQAMRDGDIQCFIGAMGLSVLHSATPQDDAFIRQNLRFLFSTRAWSLRRTDLTCDSDKICELLSDGND